MPPEMLSFSILTIAVLLLGGAMLADRAGWRYPVPRLRLGWRWLGLIYALLVLLAAIQVFAILSAP